METTLVVGECNNVCIIPESRFFNSQQDGCSEMIENLPTLCKESGRLSNTDLTRWDSNLCHDRCCDRLAGALDHLTTLRGLVEMLPKFLANTAYKY